MEDFTYDDLENREKNIRRLATIEESINRSLLYEGDINKLSCKNTDCCYLTYIITGLIIFMVIIILVVKYSL